MHGLGAAASLLITGLPPGGPTPEFERFLAETPPAGLLLFRRDFGTAGHLPALVDRLREMAAPHPLLICVDEEGGFVSQLAPDLPVPPSARVLGRACGEQETEELGAYTGRCLRALGVDVDFAPTLDVDAEPANPVIGPRSFSADAEAVAALGLGFARGLRSAGVLPCAKHFPGHGDTQLDSHLALARCAASGETLAARDLVPFRAAVADALPLFMVAHVHYPALDPEERPATLSPPIVTGLLRGELGYGGVIVTDAMEMHAVARRYPPHTAARRALEAGCDLLLYGAFGGEVREVLAGLAADLERDEAALRHALEATRARLAGLRAQREGAPPATALPPGPPLDLVALARRGLRWLGPPPRPLAAGERCLVLEPRWASGPPLADLLNEAGCQVSGRVWDDPTDLPDPTGFDSCVVALARRVAPTEAEAALHARFAAHPGLRLVAFGQDAYLADFQGLRGRLSACDPGEPMRRAVSAALTETSAPAGA